MQVAIYARVSTLNQQQEGMIASQVQILKQHIQQQGWSLLLEHEFLDDGVSGARLDRPALDRLRNGAQRGEFDAVVVLAPDRLARNYAHQWLLVEEFAKLDTQLIFLQNPFGDSPQGKLLTQMQGMIAEYERAQITEAKLRPSSRLRCLTKRNCNCGATPKSLAECISRLRAAICCGRSSNAVIAGLASLPLDNRANAKSMNTSTTSAKVINR
jgi:hypothetical protein